MERKIRCAVCGAMSEIVDADYLGTTILVINCPTCGRYSIWQDKPIFDEHKTKSFLYYNNRTSNKITVLRSEAIIKGNVKQLKQEFIAKGLHIDPNFQEKTELDIENWYPEQFQDKVDMILRKLADKKEPVGKPIILTVYEIVALLFLKVENVDDINSIDIDIDIGTNTRIQSVGGMVMSADNEKIKNMDINKQFNFYIEYFSENKLLKICKSGYSSSTSSVPSFEITILPDGFKIIYELQKNYSKSRDVFVAMSFDDNNQRTSEAIKEAIGQSGFSHKFMKDIIHNKQIVPEMLRLIRESRFLIMDISDQNYGAYFEAGYAMGLGKEIIITCDEKKFKPHFDIAQKQILKWKGYADLTKQLTEWIKDLFSDYEKEKDIA